MKNFEYPDGATPLDPNEIDGLLLTHITNRAELDRWEQENILDAIRWVEKRKPTDIFTETFIKNLHRKMFCNVWKWAGSFRQSDKNIGVPWYQVATSFADLLENAKLWIELKDETPAEIAVRFHHKLVKIHPFPNGNGRHARLITDILLKYVLKQPQFTWGGTSFSEPTEMRKVYIDALHEADMGNYRPLLKFTRS